MSLAPSESSRASTPIEVHDTEVAAQPMTPKAISHASVNDDVPMIDISPGRHELVVAPRVNESSGKDLPPSPNDT